MQSIQDYLQDQEPTIHSIAYYADQCIKQSSLSVLTEHNNELTHLFNEHGDRAYGVYIQKFMAPFFKQLSDYGLITRPGFNLADSVENWGPPEERERCAWYVIKKPDETLLGTLILQVYHSHVKFNIPKAPRAFALEETEREAILNALSNTMVRIHQDPKDTLPDVVPDDYYQQWEYHYESGLGDILKNNSGRTLGLLIDNSLSCWGRHGWELVSFVPQNEQLLAFFKRPVR
ncbi:DUF6022 family protein [Paenibacillus sp. GCM10027628]|uniref:DUF6022 family protein n=1 Tax=Paenibacillus sp. GCM10027628 TaxID=3273413 RepID=UPI003625F9F5